MKHNGLKDKIGNFLLANSAFRKVRSFFYQKVVPIAVRAAVFLVALLIALIVFLKVFQPVYLEKIYKKSYFYFLHYLSLDNREFAEINVSGNNRTKEEEIIEIVHKVQKNITQDTSKDYEPLIKKLVLEIKKNLPWVNKVVITRSMPNILDILITEYEPFAIWQNDGKKYITDKDGNVVLPDNVDEFKQLIILSGRGANIHAKSLFNIFTIDPKLSGRVYSATWIGGRRWDIRFENGLLVKLPESNISDAWNRLIKIYNMPGSIMGLNVIDLRISDKIYLEYGDSVIKEIKNL